MRYIKYLLLIILPLLYFFFSGIIFLPWRPFYTIGPDPVYIYLFSGTTIASGNLSIFYIDNPGIPVQYFCGAVIWFRHLFNQSTPLYQDVLRHPESYIYALCVAGAILLGVFTWFTGYYVFRKTNQVGLALLFQMTPLIYTHGILVTGTPSPESFYMGAGMLFIAWLYCNAILPNPQNNTQTGWKQVIIYGVFTAFLISCKYICFPLMFLVLFVLPSNRLRIKYLFLFFLFLGIFMSPALPAWRSIQSWFFNLATHTGHYGLGAKGFVNTSEYKSNIAASFKEDFYFTGISLLLFISLLVTCMRQRQAGEKSRPYLRALWGVAFSSCILILVVAKQYSFHYLMPINLCYPLIIASAFHVFKDSVNLKLLKNKYIVNTLFFIFLIFMTASQVKVLIDYPPRLRPPATANFLANYKTRPIIMAADFKSSRIEPALIIGAAYTGDYRNHYWEFLKRIYPYSYQYKYPQPMITHWDEVVYMPELIAKYSQAVFYFIGEDSAMRNATLNKLTLWGKDTLALAGLVFSLRETNEYVYELNGNSCLADTLLHRYTEKDFDLEKLTPDGSKFISSDNKDTALGANLLNKEEHHSGNNSIKMNWKNQHSLSYRIRALPGEMVVVDVWRKASDDKGCIELTSAKGNDLFMSGQTAVDSGANGWKRIQCKCLVPPSVKDSTICSSVYYYGRGTAYFDDLSVRVYPIKK